MTRPPVIASRTMARKLPARIYLSSPTGFTAYCGVMRFNAATGATTGDMACYVYEVFAK